MLVAHLHDLGRVDVLVGPVHLRHVHQALDAGLDFDERAVVGEVGDLAEQARALRVAARDAHPRVFAQLLQAERHAVLLGVELEHFRGDFVTHCEHLGRMLDAAPGQVGDVQQAVDAAQVHEGAIVGDVLDDALDRRAFGQRRKEVLALGTCGLLEHRAAGHDHVVPLAVELDDLEQHGLAFERRGVLDRAQVDERPGQEGTDAVGHHRQAALHLAGDRAFDLGAFFQRFFQVHPGGEALGLVARQAGLAEAVFEGLDRHADEIADLDVKHARVAAELFERDVALGLEARIDRNKVMVDCHDFGGDDLADAHFLSGQAFLEESGKRSGSGRGRDGAGHCLGQTGHVKGTWFGPPATSFREGTRVGLSYKIKAKRPRGRPPTCSNRSGSSEMTFRSTRLLRF